MKIRNYPYHQLFFVVVMFFFCNMQLDAQRMQHGASRGGGGGGGRGATQRAPASRPANTSRPMNNGSINGGSVKSPNRTAKTQPSSQNLSRNENRPSTLDKKPDIGRNDNSKINNSRNDNSRVDNSKINNNSKIDRDSKIGNKTNISGNNVNINVDRSRDINNINNRNTVVRHNNIGSYGRPPYAWGGHRYYSYHPYFYHPFVPFYWGPAWHPWGFFMATLATTAIVVAVADAQYHYDEGVWYSENNGGYTAVQAPVGGTVTNIPNGAQTVVVNNSTNYYYGGAFYEKDGTTYTVVPPPAGAVVDKLPEGGQEVKIGDQTYVKIGETYYQPVQIDGQNKYEIAQVENE